MTTASPPRRPGRGLEQALFGLQIVGAGIGGFLLLVLAARHNVRIDFTPGHEHSLTAATREILARLDRGVTITAFYEAQDAEGRGAMHDLLERYATASSRIRVGLRDLDRSPGLANALGVTRYGAGVVEIEGNPARIPLDVVDEEAVSGALLRLVDPARRVVYFTAGHGEHDPFGADERRGYGTIGQALAAEQFVIRRLETLGSGPDLDEAAAIVVAGPRQDFAAVEIDALAGFIAAGGGVLVLVDPETPPRLAAFLDAYGLHPSNDVVVDERGSLVGGDPLLPRITYLNQNVLPRPPADPPVLADAQSIALGDLPTRIERTYLASTAEHTWADTDRGIRRDRAARFDPGADHRGPIPVAAYARAGDGDDDTGGGLAVVGDADFASNLYVGLLGNRDFFLSLLDLLTHRELRGMLDPSRPRGGISGLTLTTAESRIIFWATVVFPPTIVMLAGIGAAIRRRRSVR